MNNVDFLLPVRKLVFGRNDWSSLYGCCKDDDSATKHHRVTDIADLAINPKTGETVSHGLKYNRQAFRQVCSIISGGLYTDLSSVYDEAQAGDAEKIIRAFNNLAGASIVRLQRTKIVIDDRSNEITGLVGLRYYRVSNFELVDTIRPYIAPSSHMFMEAELVNRELSAVLSRPSSRSTVKGVHWAEGLALFNSETTKRAVAVPRALLDSATRSFSMAEETQENRMIHRRRKQFRQHLDAMLVGAVSQDPWLHECEEKITKLVSSRLSAKGVESMLVSCKSRLQEAGVGPRLAERLDDYIKSRVEDVRPIDFYFALLSIASKSKGASRIIKNVAYRMVYPQKAER